MAGEWVSWPLENEILRGEANLGSGKTQWAKRQCRAVQRALVVEPRIALADQSSAELGLANYQELPRGPIDLRDVPKLCIVVNSLHRIAWERCADRDIPELLVVEESETTLASLLTPAFFKDKSAAGVYRSLIDLGCRVLAAGGTVVTLDAYPGGLTDSFCTELAKASGKPVTKRAHYRRVELVVERYAKVPEFWSAFVADVADGKRVAFGSMSRSAVQLAEELCRGLGASCLAHHSKQDTDAREALRNPGESWAEPQVVLYSPTAGCGVSYDREDAKFDVRYALWREGAGQTWRDALQMTRRVRNNAVTTPVLRVACAGRSGKPQSLEQVRLAMAGRINLTRRVAQSRVEGTTLQTDFSFLDWDARDKEHLRLAVQAAFSRGQDGYGIEQKAVAALVAEGAREQPGTAPALPDGYLRAAGQAVRGREVEAVLTAAAEPECVLRGADRKGVALQRSAELARLTDLLGRLPTERDVLRHRHGGSRVYELGAALAWLSGRVDGIAGRDETAVARQVRAFAGARWAHAELAGKLLGAFVAQCPEWQSREYRVTGDRPEFDLQGFCSEAVGIVRESMAKGLTAPAWLARYERARMGDGEFTPLNLLTEVLSGFGLKLDSTRKRVDGVATRVYRWDPATNSPTLADAERQYQRARGEKVDSLDFLECWTERMASEEVDSGEFSLEECLG